MKVIIDEHLENTTVQIDGNHFENCIISQCVLIFGGGDFSWMNCKFVNCQIRFVGAAWKTINFLKHFGMVPQAPKIAEAEGSTLVH